MSSEDETQAQDMPEGIPYSSPEHPNVSLQVSWADDDLSYPTTLNCCPHDCDTLTKQYGTD